jgi:acetylornithine/succinyldiaminopimelate/putrescine aminotransferase
MKLFDVYPLYDVTPVKAKDVFVYDQNGTEYLDLYGGHAVISIGHGHPHYIKKLKEDDMYTDHEATGGILSGDTEGKILW